jgi:hypothetical protein
MRRRELAHSTHLQVLKEVFGFNNFDLASWCILVLSGGLFGFDQLLVDDAIEEFVKGETQLHHGQHQFSYDFNRFLIHALKVDQRRIHSVAAFSLI